MIEIDARKVAVLLREGASTASNGDETLLDQVADDIEDAAESQAPDPGRLHQALCLARTLAPRLLSWADALLPRPRYSGSSVLAKVAPTADLRSRCGR